MQQGHQGALQAQVRRCHVLSTYPTEHDYTRNSRLELALQAQATNIESLRLIKRQIIRSHTKNIYKADDDAALVASIPEIQRIATRLDRKSARSGSGFVKYHPFVVREYFGGMYRHFQSVVPLLKEGANCAYVVGDQCSYLERVHSNRRTPLDSRGQSRARDRRDSAMARKKINHWQTKD